MGLHSLFRMTERLASQGCSPTPASTSFVSTSIALPGCDYVVQIIPTNESKSWLTAISLAGSKGIPSLPRSVIARSSVGLSKRSRGLGIENETGNRNNDRERDRGHRHISHSRSNDKSRNRSKSRSRSPSKSKRTSGFDMAPATPALPGAAFAGLVGMPQPVPGSIPTMFSLATPLATRHARRVYVGGLPPLANEQTIATFFSQVMSATFFSQVMSAVGGNSAGPGDAVVNVYINHEKKFAFVEMRTVEEASNAMALDGIVFEGVSVRVRRPTDYNPPLAAVLGPSQPNSHLNLAVVGLIPGATGGAEGPDRIFVGGLPYYFSDAQIRELLESFGDSGNSKGYGFCVYKDPTATDVACASLNGLKMGDKTLTVRRATASTGQGKPEQEMVLQQAQHHIALQKMVLQAAEGLTLPGVETMPSTLTSSPPTKVVCLTEVVSENELREDGEYEEIIEDMREESGKFGSLVNVVIPRPSPTGEDIPGVGKVFLEYADTSASMRALAALHGRKFGGNVVTAVYYPEDRFFRGDYSEIITVD